MERILLVAAVLSFAACDTDPLQSGDTFSDAQIAEANQAMVESSR